MANRPKNSEVDIIEQYRVTLENAISRPQVAKYLDEFGYSSSVIAEGKALWNRVNDAFNHNKKEDDETTEAYANFVSKNNELHEIYSMHRKKAKVVFRNNEVMLSNLNLIKASPRPYVRWIDNVSKFYRQVSSDDIIINKLKKLKVIKEELDKTNKLVAELKKARNEYLAERGEDQEATKLKDIALAILSDWMDELYAVARIVLHDHPQLLEVLGKFVRS